MEHLTFWTQSHGGLSGKKMIFRGVQSRMWFLGELAVNFQGYVLGARQSQQSLKKNVPTSMSLRHCPTKPSWEISWGNSRPYWGGFINHHLSLNNPLVKTLFPTWQWRAKSQHFSRFDVFPYWKSGHVPMFHCQILPAKLVLGERRNFVKPSSN